MFQKVFNKNILRLFIYQDTYKRYLRLQKQFQRLILLIQSSYFQKIAAKRQENTKYYFGLCYQMFNKYYVSCDKFWHKHLCFINKYIQMQERQQITVVQDELKRFTDETKKQIRKMKLTVNSMSLTYLQSFLQGLLQYYPSQKDYSQYIKQIIAKKQSTSAVNKQRKKATMAEKAINWWTAMGIIFIFLVGIITGEAYTINQIITSQIGKWIKYLIIAIIVGIGLIFILVICKCIWPKRDIREFQTLFTEKDALNDNPNILDDF